MRDYGPYDFFFFFFLSPFLRVASVTLVRFYTFLNIICRTRVKAVSRSEKCGNVHAPSGRLAVLTLNYN